MFVKGDEYLMFVKEGDTHMDKHEKILKALECCTAEDRDCCKTGTKCPYFYEAEERSVLCVDLLLRDIFDAMKAQ